MNGVASAGSAFRPRASSKPRDRDDLAYLTIAEASDLIARRELSPVDLVDACLGRIHRYDPKIKAWITLLADQARRDAKAAADEIARHGPRSPLHGIPLGHKDLYDV